MRDIVIKIVVFRFNLMVHIDWVSESHFLLLLVTKKIVVYIRVVMVLPRSILTGFVFHETY